MFSSVWRFHDSEIEPLYSKRSRATVPGPMLLHAAKINRLSAVRQTRPILVTGPELTIHFTLVCGHAPRWIGIVLAHLLDDLGRLLSQVLLIHAALLIDDESHHAGVAVFRRPRDEPETANHVSINHVIVLPTRRRFAL